MDGDRLRKKLSVLADAAKYDASCASSGSGRRGRAGDLGSTTSGGICHSYTPDGRCVSLLKVLLTNHCSYDCVFCVNRASSDVPRARFTIDEVVYLTMEFYRRNYIEGLFLSSGIARSPDDTMEQIVAVGRRLREDERFRGYLHFKVVPGAAPALVAAAGRYADRLSANVELPTQDDLDRLAPDKRLDTVDRTMSEIDERLATPAGAGGFAPSGQSTQLVVGATPAADSVILGAAARLYRQHRLRRIYYTAFSPFPGADPRLPVRPAPLAREHRLYQADWLVRRYGFDHDELFAPGESNLSPEIDPKHAWALRHRHLFPVDVNRADRELLLRVPGLGLRAVEAVLRARAAHRLRLDDLQRLRVPLRRARAFVVTADHNPGLALLDRADLAARTRARSRQLSLFEAREGARHGQL